MFNDGRSKRVVFVAHCLLNQNSISDGTAVYPAAFRELIDFFLSDKIGIIQMPCPEFCCLGLDRGNAQGADSPVVVENTRIRESMLMDAPNKKLLELVDYVVKQILEYKKYGVEIVGIVGINRSPSCGIDTTSDSNMEVNGMGVFMENICKELIKLKITIPMIGIKATDNMVLTLRKLL